ncbi:hypothetical protein A2U01_0116804, partial [Trifolium medium]|nr:hypothetical protein [Trifolium medium]
LSRENEAHQTLGNVVSFAENSWKVNWT